MLRLATDEDFNNRILRGVQRRNSTIDIVRAQDAGLSGQGDDKVLEWAASEGRVLLTHDVTTMNLFVDERLDAGLPMPGVFELAQDVPIGLAIEEYLYWLDVVLKANGKDRLDSSRYGKTASTILLTATHNRHKVSPFSSKGFAILARSKFLLTGF